MIPWHLKKSPNNFLTTTKGKPAVTTVLREQRCKMCINILEILAHFMAGGLIAVNTGRQILDLSCCITTSAQSNFL